MKLKSVTISAFRGFKKEQTIELDNNLILIKGSNGSGKSSFVEAIEWLFYDEISRKKKSLCRSEYSGEFLRNLHAEKDQVTFVEAVLDSGGKEIRLKKKLLSPEKKEYSVDGSSVEDFSPLGINLAEVHKPILSQVEVKHYVETDPKDRFEETNKILGIGILSEFRSDLQDLQKDKKNDSTYKSFKKIYDGLEVDLKDLKLTPLWVEMEKRPSFPKKFESKLIKTINETFQFAAKSVNELSQKLDSELTNLGKKIDGSKCTQTLIVPDNSLSPSIDKILIEMKQLFTILKQVKPATAELHTFLETGKKLITDTTCPFCLEKTVTPEKEEEIDERIRLTKAADLLLSEIKNKIAATQKEKEDFDRNYSFSISLSAIEEVRARISNNPIYLDETKSIDSIKKDIVSLNTKVSSFSQKMTELLDEARNVLEGKSKFEEKYETAITNAERLAKETKNDLNELRGKLQSLLASLISKAPSLSAQDNTALRKVVLFQKMINNLEAVKYVGIYENNLIIISRLIEKVEKFEKTKSGKLLSKLNRTIKNFYEKMNPREKTQFSEIITKGKSRKIQIKATSYGKDMNPVSCFSEAHMNCLCLSIYFSQRVLNNPYWDYVVLDDPIQSMDEDHSKNLIRIFDDVHERKQVIVTSHNARFCRDFVALFYGRDYTFYEFSGDSIEGPIIDLQDAPFNMYIKIAKRNAGGNSEERATSGTNLRKAVERFAAEILIQKGKLSFKSANSLKLEERLEKIEKAVLLALKEIGEIKAMLDICDPACHDDPKREVTSRELKDGISVIEALYSNNLR